MTNIIEYFRGLYAVAETKTEADWNAVLEYEEKVYEMEDDEFFAWADKHNIDLTATEAVLGTPTLVTQLWAWDMED